MNTQITSTVKPLPPIPFTTRDGFEVYVGELVTLIYATVYRTPRVLTGSVESDGRILVEGRPELCEKIVSCFAYKSQMIEAIHAQNLALSEDRNTSIDECESLSAHLIRFDNAAAAL